MKSLPLNPYIGNHVLSRGRIPVACPYSSFLLITLPVKQDTVSDETGHNQKITNRKPAARESVNVVVKIKVRRVRKVQKLRRTPLEFLCFHFRQFRTLSQNTPWWLANSKSPIKKNVDFDRAASLLLICYADNKSCQAALISLCIFCLPISLASQKSMIKIIVSVHDSQKNAQDCFTLTISMTDLLSYYDAKLVK